MIFTKKMISAHTGLLTHRTRRHHVRWASKPVWALIIFFVNIIGPLAYFFVGREDA